MGHNIETILCEVLPYRECIVRRHVETSKKQERSKQNVGCLIKQANTTECDRDMYG